MKLLGYFMAFAIPAFAHDFKHCNANDMLKIDHVDVIPDKPIKGEQVGIQFSGTPSVEVENGASGDIVARVMGVKVYSMKFDACNDLNVPCPLEPNEKFLASFGFEVPKEIPSNIEIDLEVTIKSKDGDTVTCLETKVDIVSDNLSKGKDEITLSQLEFMYNAWREEHSIGHSLSYYKNFVESLMTVLKHNAKEAGNTYKLALNKFAHLSKEEFREQKLGYLGDLQKTRDAVKVIPNQFFRSKPIDIDFDNVNKDDLPKEVDWEKDGGVTPVKDQQSCGSCWSFSATGAIEGAYFRKYGTLISFSEEQLVDCDKTCFGCQGGLMDYAFEWIEQNGGLCSEDDYPYISGHGQRGSCHPCTVVPNSIPSDYVDVPANKEAALMAAVAQQPVSVAIEADQAAFQLYHSGVLQGNCGTHLDHGVLVVGYGTSEDGIDYWKVKNSWGAKWGMDGYVLIERGKKFPNGGECGVLMQASYPVYNDS